MELFARKCDITGEGMNEGYCIEDGLMYIKYEKDLIKHLRVVENEYNPYGLGDLTDEEMLEEYYDADYYYWTEWEELDEDVNFTIDGKEIITNN
jgi:hypothetical protein